MNKRILLIEDNPQNRYLASFLMEARGWEMVHAEDGPTGVDLAASAQPALILLDIQLPGMDGLQATTQLKASERTRGIPVIALTALAMKGDEERIRAAGCDGYISKPMSRKPFLSLVAAHLAAPPTSSPVVDKTS